MGTASDHFAILKLDGHERAPDRGAINRFTGPLCKEDGLQFVKRYFFTAGPHEPVLGFDNRFFFKPCRTSISVVKDVHRLANHNNITSEELQTPEIVQMNDPFDHTLLVDSE